MTKRYQKSARSFEKTKNRCS